MIADQCRTVKWWYNCSSCLHNDTFECGPVTSHIEYHHLLFFPSFCIPGQNYLVAIKTAAGGSAGKPQVPTPAGASTKPTVAGKSTGPTVATPSTGAPTPSPQSSVEAKVSKAFTLWTLIRWCWNQTILVHILNERRTNACLTKQLENETISGWTIFDNHSFKPNGKADLLMITARFQNLVKIC